MPIVFDGDASADFATPLPVAEGGTGSTTGAIASTGAISSTVGVAAPYLLVRDEKSVGTAGGTSSTGVNTRVLNTVSDNTITGASLSSDQITLPAGTYQVFASAPVYEGGASKLFLYNITTSALEIAGLSSQGNSAMNSQAMLIGRFTIASSSVFEIRHQIANGTANGLGVAVNVAAAGVEIYASIQITKEA